MPIIIPNELIYALRKSGTMEIYPPKSQIFSQGETASGFYIISSGRVRVFTLTADGHERTIEILEVGRIFGDSSFLSNSRRSVNIEAVITSEIIRYSAEELIAMCTKQKNS